MRASFNTITKGEHTGYGQAAKQFQQALTDAGMEWGEQERVIINFCMPPDYIAHGYNIGYTPWESTEVPKKWLPGLKGVHDLWSTSKWSAKILGDIAKREAFVVPHGIDPLWTPKFHSRHDVFTFAHCGEPAIRKGGDILLQAWDTHFKYRSDCRLIIKAVGHTVARVKDSDGSIVGSAMHYNNCVLVTNVWTRERLLYFYQDEIDCMVYPTRGEGFGLIPFEAIAAGCPTILPNGGGTADFAKYGIPLNKYMWVHSNDKTQHPGLWMDHNVDELIHHMERAIEKYDQAAETAYYNSLSLHNEFNWDSIAKLAMDRIKLVSG